MPYIKSATRRRWIDQCISMKLAGVGELNYAITRLISNYLGPEMDYARLNNITGVLHDVAVEFDRRVVAPYEDKKCRQNGDVYELQHAPVIQPEEKKTFSDEDFRKFMKRIDEGEEIWDRISRLWPGVKKSTERKLSWCEPHGRQSCGTCNEPHSSEKKSSPSGTAPPMNAEDHLHSLLELIAKDAESGDNSVVSNAAVFMTRTVQFREAFHFLRPNTILLGGTPDES